MGGARFFPPPEPGVQADGSKRYEGVTYAAVSEHGRCCLTSGCPRRRARLRWWCGFTAAPGCSVIGTSRRPCGRISSCDELIAAVSRRRHHRLSPCFGGISAQLRGTAKPCSARRMPTRPGSTRAGLEFGVSRRGGHLAALVAVTGQRPDLEGTVGVVGPSSAVDAAVDWYGVADLTAQSQHSASSGPARTYQPSCSCPRGPTRRWTRPRRASGRQPNQLCDPEAPPFLLIHGAADAVVPYRQSELLELP